MYITRPISVLTFILAVQTANAQYKELLKFEKLNISELELVTTEWIKQPFDHFDSSNIKKCQMRYFQRTDLFKAGGPVVLFIGGESEADPLWLTTGLAYEVAKDSNAFLVMSEHRYYGLSQPEEVPKFTFLNSKQTLADLSNLLSCIKANPKLKDSKVLVIGGSYPGMLATWMRLIYPGCVDFALASSAPVLAKVNFLEYLEAVAVNYLKHSGKPCYANIQGTFQRYAKLLKTPEGIALLKTEENICESSDLTLDYNQYLFTINKIMPFMSLSQNGSPRNITDHCGGVPNQPKSTFSILSMMNVFEENPTSDASNCTVVDFEKELKEIQQSSYAWLYQSCAEFGFAQTTESQNQPFGQNYPLGAFIALCSRAFSEGFTSQAIKNNIAKTNSIYGGLSVVNKVTNVIFTNFDMDPWHRLSVLPSSHNFEIINNNLIMLSENGSHCQDLGTRRINESSSFTFQRELTKMLLKCWLF